MLKIENYWFLELYTKIVANKNKKKYGKYKISI